MKEVEDLDSWAQKAQNKTDEPSSKQDAEVEELRKEIARMMLFIEEDCVTQTDRKAVDSILEEMKAGSRNDKAMLELPSFGKTLKANTNSSKELPPINMTKGAYINSVKITTGKGQEVESLFAKGNISSSSSSKNSSEVTDYRNKMDLKSQLKYYQSLHEPTEEQLKKHMESIQQELEKKNAEIEEILKRNTGIEDQIQEIEEQIEDLKVNKGMKKNKVGRKPVSVTFLRELVVTEEMQNKVVRDRETVKSLGEDTVNMKRQIKMNEMDIKKIEVQCALLSKKQKLFESIKVKLYFKILKDGRDIR